MNRLLPAILLALTPVLAHGATYYVAKTGSDSNSCAQAQSASTPEVDDQGRPGLPVRRRHAHHQGWNVQ